MKSYINIFSRPKPQARPQYVARLFVLFWGEFVLCPCTNMASVFPFPTPPQPPRTPRFCYPCCSATLTSGECTLSLICFSPPQFPFFISWGSYSTPQAFRQELNVTSRFSVPLAPPLLVFVDSPWSLTDKQVNQHELDGDWFQSIRDKLNWNLRTMQTPYDAEGDGDQSLNLSEDNHPDNQSSPTSPFQPRYFTLPGSREETNGKPKGDSSRGSPI